MVAISKCSVFWSTMLTYTLCDTLGSKNIIKARNIKCLQPLVTHAQHHLVHNVCHKYAHSRCES